MKRLICILATLLLSACTTSIVADAISMSQGPANTVDVTQLPAMHVVGVTVVVPETLRVSEENSFRPDADIVWRGDPFGDRQAQVKAILEGAFARGVAELNGETPVDIHIELSRFHAVTERTRYSIGGVHDIDFLLTVTDQQSGEVIIPTYLVNSQFKAFGGDTAIAAERAGLTQKVRISEHLARLIRQELTGIRALPMPDDVPVAGGGGDDVPAPESEPEPET